MVRRYVEGIMEVTLMSVILNEWVDLEMRNGVFKDKPSRSWRLLFLLCVFIFLFLWSVPAQAIVPTK